MLKIKLPQLHVIILLVCFFSHIDVILGFNFIFIPEYGENKRIWKFADKKNIFSQTQSMFFCLQI